MHAGGRAAAACVMPPGSLVGVLERVEKRRRRAVPGRKASSSALLEAALRAIQVCTGTHIAVTNYTTPAALTARVSMAILKADTDCDGARGGATTHCAIMMSRALYSVDVPFLKDLDPDLPGLPRLLDDSLLPRASQSGGKWGD